MAIYEKPTKTLMLEFVKENLKPGQIFEKKQAVNWFKQHYPNIRPTMVQMHVEGMAINSKVRKHHPSTRNQSWVIRRLLPRKADFPCFEHCPDLEHDSPSKKRGY
jgi:hypothetical protein